MGLDVQHHPLVAEADAEVLQAPVPAAGRRQHLVELAAEHGGGVTGRDPHRRFAAPPAVIVIEHPPADDRVAQLDRSCPDGVVLEVMLLAVDPSHLSVLVAAVVFAHEHLDLLGKAEEAAVEVAGDPMPPGVGDALRRLRSVVPLVLAEQHDLGAVSLAAQKPRLLRFAQRAPEVAAAVRPLLGLEPPAPVGVALEAHQRTVPVLPGAVLEPVRVPGAGGNLCADAEVAAAGLLAAAGRQLVDVVAQLCGGHPRPVDYRQLPPPATRGVKPLPVQIPHHPAVGISAERRDRIQRVDRQLSQTLKVRALAAQALQQERRVRDRELVPTVWTGHLAVAGAGPLSELLGHPLGRYRTGRPKPPYSIPPQPPQLSANASARAATHVP